MMIDLWEISNEEVHGKEEVVNQQKRKHKVTISVQALHQLQDQTLPSNAFLFYQDTETNIKNATAAKLKGFIIMKTKSITNSMSKWDKQATCRVKSIIDWIKIGGNNNREAIKRVEKRNRDHFRHKAHKKPRKK